MVFPHPDPLFTSKSWGFIGSDGLEDREPDKDIVERWLHNFKTPDRPRDDTRRATPHVKTLALCQLPFRPDSLCLVSNLTGKTFCQVLYTSQTINLSLQPRARQFARLLGRIIFMPIVRVCCPRHA